MQVAVFPPSSVVTVTTASPAFTAVTLPAPSTVAISVLSELHVTFRLSALSGFTVAVSVSVSPSVKVSSVLSRDTSVTPTALAFTVTLQVAVFPPSSVVTVTTASPAFTAVTLPAPSTVATSVLSELHVTFLLSALSGLTVAVSVSVSPSVRVSSVLSRVTSVTPIALAFTVTAQVPDLPSAVAVTVAVPGLRPWTVPALSTVATLRSDDDHATALSDAASGETLADSTADSPSMISIRDGVTATDETPAVSSLLPQEVMRRMAAATVSSARRVCKNAHID